MNSRLTLNTMGAQQTRDLRVIADTGGIWNCHTTYVQRQRLDKLRKRDLVVKSDGRWILSISGLAYVREQGWV